MTRADFTITTTPTGYGNYQAYDGGPFLVDFSPAAFNIAVGGNPVSATCGASEAGDDLVGTILSVQWGAVTGSEAPTGDFDVSYSAEVQGDSATTGKISISGPFPAVGGDTGPTLTNGVPYNGNVTLEDPGSQFTATSETMSLTASEGSGDSSGAGEMPQAALAAAASALAAGGPGAAQLIGPLVKAAKAAAGAPAVHILPAGLNAGLPLTLSAVAGNYVNNVNTCTATVRASAGGHGVTFLLERFWADNPSATVKVGKPNPLSATPIVGGKQGAPEKFLVEANEVQIWTLQLGANVLPDWAGDPPSQPSDGPLNAAIVAFGSAPGDGWSLRKASFVANLDAPNNNWQPVGLSDQLTVYFNWF